MKRVIFRMVMIIIKAKKKKVPLMFLCPYATLNIRAICLGRGALAKALQLEKEAPLSTALPFGALPE